MALPPVASGEAAAMSRRSPVAQLWRAYRGALVVAVAVAFITYPVLIPDIGWQQEFSWAAALHMANNQGLVFGRDLVFTYGPLGWITTATMFFETTGAIAIAVRFPLLVAVAFVVWRRLRQLCPWPVAIIGCVALSWMVGSVLLIGGESPLLVLFAVLGPYLARLASPERTPIPRWVPAALGALTAVMLLVKFDVGLDLAAWSLFMVGAEWIIHRQGWRRLVFGLAWTVDGFLLALVLGWLACGQPLRYLGRWLELSLSLFFGLSDAMALPGNAWELQLAFASILGLAVLARERIRGIGGPRRWLFWLALISAVFVFAKQGFLRHDGHSLRWWAFVGVAVLVLATRRTVTTAGFIVVPSVIVAGAIVGTFSFASPSESVSSVQRAWGQVTSHAEREKVRTWGRYILPKTFPLPDEIVSAVRGKSVHIAPFRAVVAWMYPSVKWRPFPILQHYAGITPTLDRWTADFVRSKRAPQFVVYERFAIDDRVDRWEPPETMLALLCNYREVTGSGVWQLFERRPKSACGTRRTIDIVEGRIGEELYTPLGNDDEIVVGQFRSRAFTPDPFTKLRWTLTRPPIMDVFVQSDAKRHRFVMGTASQDHVLELPECLRSSMAGFDAGTMRSLTFTQSHGRLTPGAKVVSTYEAIRFTCDG